MRVLNDLRILMKLSPQGTKIMEVHTSMTACLGILDVHTIVLLRT
jgi:hypothetical protein